MSDYKIIFTGPSGAGKSTAIAAISDIAPVVTDARSKKEEIKHYGKKGITVALDYGLIKLNDKDKIHLYGTPGQERFDFMWEILSEGGLGLILLIDNTRHDPLSDMDFFLRSFHSFISKTKLAIGVTQMDKSNEPSLDAFYERLHKSGLKPPVFEVDARVNRDVSLLVQSLLYSLDPGLS